MADRLEGRDGPRAARSRAAHRAAAGDVARAVPLLRAAAQRALTMGAGLEAAALWRRAAELTEPTDPAAAAADRRAASSATDSAAALRAMSGERA